MGTPLSDTPPPTQGDSFSIASTMDAGRRNALTAMSLGGLVGGVGAAIPIACTMMPSEKAKAAGAPITVDIGALPVGGMMIAEWRGKPIWVIRRTPEMIKAIEEAANNTALTLVDIESKSSIQQKNCQNIYRSINKEVLILVGICTHLGCSPKPRFEQGAAEGMPAGWSGGFYCPCHGSIFDLAGRVYTGVPAPTNLTVPPHYYVSDTQIFVGEEAA